MDVVGETWWMFVGETWVDVVGEVNECCNFNTMVNIYYTKISMFTNVILM